MEAGSEHVPEKQPMDEQHILDIIIKEYSWEEVLYQIIIAENLDPWDIDIIKLADAFIKYLKKLQQMDFRISGKVILTCGIFLRMKSEALKIHEEEKKTRQHQQSEPLNIADVPTLAPPVIRRPIRKVTLQELVVALEKAFEIRERKEKRWEVRVRKMEIEEDDVQVRIQNFYNSVTSLLGQLNQDKVLFSVLVGEWKPDRVVKLLLPLLYLTQEKKLDYEQEVLFGDLYVTKPKVEVEFGDIETDEEAKRIRKAHDAKIAEGKKKPEPKKKKKRKREKQMQIEKTNDTQESPPDNQNTNEAPL